MTETGKSLGPADLMREEANLLAAGLKLHNQGLELLLAEMRALATLLPATDSRLPTDAEVEADFDNIPI